MQDFNHYLNQNEEIGFVDQALHSLVYVKGLPQARPNEVVVFESGEIGQVFSLTPDYIEVVILSPSNINVGTKVARTNHLLSIPVSTNLLATTIDPLGINMTNFNQNSPNKTAKPVALNSNDPKSTKTQRSIYIKPPQINKRASINEPLETGVSWIDLVVPLGKGQRELVIGDRKTGKTEFLLQTILAQALKGTICIYAAIAKRNQDLIKFEEFFSKHKINSKVIMVATISSDPAGLIYLTPYTAMTIAEYFRDQGKDALVIIDDLTAHAKYYREITLLAKRFPGRSSYPGDIFYIHSSLLERAGNFIVQNNQDKSDSNDNKKNNDHLDNNSKNSQISQENQGKTKNNASSNTASISCLPVAELVMSDLTGYIQTNIMAMTDGHILFDINLYNQGRRPPINPFLSVTRVGHQTQTPLLRDISRQITSFLVKIENLRQFMHFGAELSEDTRKTLNLGDKIQAFFNQSNDVILPINLNIILVATIWGGLWSDNSVIEMKQDIKEIIKAFNKDKKLQGKINSLVINAKDFNTLTERLAASKSLFASFVDQPTTNNHTKANQQSNQDSQDNQDSQSNQFNPTNQSAPQKSDQASKLSQTSQIATKKDNQDNQDSNQQTTNQTTNTKEASSSTNKKQE